MNYQSVLDEIALEIRPHFGRGKVADYIPALAKVPADKFGMALVAVDGTCYTVGEAEENFSIQSISKVLTLMLAVKYVGDALWRRVGREPSGDPFNSLTQLEYEHGIPRNPMINAGALVSVDCVVSHCQDAKETILEFVRSFSANPDIDYDTEVARSEWEHRFSNMALASYLKSYGNLENEVEQVLDVYFHQCSIAMSCRDLAHAFLPLANKGLMPYSEKRVIGERRAKRVNAIMLTCGLYDSVGDFAFRVGLPAKSGVGGGIVAVMPNEFSVAVWSPALEESGNSLIGIEALALLTSLTGKSIF